MAALVFYGITLCLMIFWFFGSIFYQMKIWAYCKKHFGPSGVAGLMKLSMQGPFAFKKLGGTPEGLELRKKSLLWIFGGFLFIAIFAIVGIIFVLTYFPEPC